MKGIKYYACKYIGHDTYPGRAVDINDVCQMLNNIIVSILAMVWISIIVAALIINLGWTLVSVVIGFIAAVYILIKLDTFVSKQYDKVKDVKIYECRK